MANLFAASGKVTRIEFEPELAARAKPNLTLLDHSAQPVFYWLVAMGQLVRRKTPFGPPPLLSGTVCRRFVTDRLLPRRFRFEAGDQLLVVDKAIEEVVPFVG